MMMIRGALLVSVSLLCGAWGAHGDNHNDNDHDDRRGNSCEWTQWGQSASHDGAVCVAAQRGLRMLARLTIDPFVEQETAEAFSLLVHYPAPLLDDDGNVFILQKGGTFVSCEPPGSGRPFPCGPAAANQQTWSIRALEWRHDKLVPRWTFESDWKPLQTGQWEMAFQSALGDRFIYIPGAGGTVFKVDKRRGFVAERINPFGTTVDPTIFVSGGITIDEDGNLFYNVIKIDPVNPFFNDAQSWLVRVSRRGSIRTVDYRTLIPGAPQATDLCYATFGFAQPPTPRPWPPPPQPDGSPTLPPQFPCMSQRAAVNITPAIGKDGTIFTVTRAHSFRANDYAFIVALKPNLSLKWATPMNGILGDGCGVEVPFGPGPFDCREGATSGPGVDPATNRLPSGQASDIGSSSPVATPDGGVIYGAFTGYNGFRGHLIKLDRHGHFKGSYDFGWDVTPGISRRGDDYSIIVKDNHYFSNGPFLVTQLDSDLNVEWQFANTSTVTCERLPDDTISCFDDGLHPDGFEWCINAPAIDRNGTVYGLNEDGYMYAIDRHGVEVERVFMTRTRAAAYTPLSIDTRGRVYAQNNGELYVLGR
jgi:outer membrane protein assembly factor BamB